MREAIAADLRRVTDRLRTAPSTRVATAAAAARALLQQLADLTLGTDARDEAREPTWRVVPTLPDEALGDQLAVLGTDLGLAVDGVDDDTLVWSPGTRRPLGACLTELGSALRHVRMAL